MQFKFRDILGHALGCSKDLEGWYRTIFDKEGKLIRINEEVTLDKIEKVINEHYVKRSDLAKIASSWVNDK